MTVVSPIDHAVLHAAIREIACGEVLLRPGADLGADGSRLYGVRLADGDFARICVDADGAAAFTVFDRHLRRFVADLHVGPGGIVGTLGDKPVEGRIACGGIDVADLVGAMRNVVAAAEGVVTFSYAPPVARAA